jgi:hypothetical protein
MVGEEVDPDGFSFAKGDVVDDIVDVVDDDIVVESVSENSV